MGEYIFLGVLFVLLIGSFIFAQHMDKVRYMAMLDKKAVLCNYQEYSKLYMEYYYSKNHITSIEELNISEQELIKKINWFNKKDIILHLHHYFLLVRRNNMVVAEWTGRFPNLCSGEWRLTIGGIDYSNAIPIEKRYGEMNTAGEYRSWHFEDWEEVFDFYEDGLEFEDWIKENEWVMSLPCAPQDVFYAIQAQDWRHGSCGGCI